MTRLYGWAPRGERLFDKVPQGKWKTATFLAALRNDRIEAPCVFDGPSCTRPLSTRAAMRKPSSLISCTHCGPDGGFSTGWESCGRTNCGREASRRDRPALTACPVERLTTGDMLGT